LPFVPADRRTPDAGAALRFRSRKVTPCSRSATLNVSDAAGAGLREPLRARAGRERSRRGVPVLLRNVSKMQGGKPIEEDDLVAMRFRRPRAGAKVSTPETRQPRKLVGAVVHRQPRPPTPDRGKCERRPPRQPRTRAHLGELGQQPQATHRRARCRRRNRRKRQRRANRARRISLDTALFFSPPTARHARLAAAALRIPRRPSKSPPTWADNSSRRRGALVPIGNTPRHSGSARLRGIHEGRRVGSQPGPARRPALRAHPRRHRLGADHELGGPEYAPLAPAIPTWRSASGRCGL